MDWWTAALGNFSNVEHSQIESIQKRPQRILDTKWNIDGDDLDFLGASFVLKGSQWSDIGVIGSFVEERTSRQLRMVDANTSDKLTQHKEIIYKVLSKFSGLVNNLLCNFSLFFLWVMNWFGVVCLNMT